MSRTKSPFFSRHAIGVGIVLFCGSGCTPMVMTADTTMSPVLLGPVRAIRAGAPEASSVIIRPFASTTKKTTSGMTFGSSGLSLTSTHNEIPLDSDVNAATLNTLTDGVALTTVECGGFFAIYVFWSKEHRWCNVSGHVYRSVPVNVEPKP